MKTLVISLGGSVIIPEKVDTIFLKNFKRLLLNFKNKYRYAIYCGGGSIARKYQKALIKIIGKDKQALDWIGISATYLNALLLKSIFSKVAEKDIIIDPTKKVNLKKSMILAAGWKPGWSTDYDAVLLAKNLKADTVINITNVNYLYDKDPRKYKNVKPIKKISFKQIKKIINKKWSPGLNAPFDPVAIRAAEKSKLKIILVGKNLANLKNLLQNKQFKGTVIS